MSLCAERAFTSSRWLHPQERRKHQPAPPLLKPFPAPAPEILVASGASAIIREVAQRVLEYGACEVSGLLSQALLVSLKSTLDQKIEEVYAKLARREGEAASEMKDACVRDGARLDIVGLESRAVQDLSECVEPLLLPLLGRDAVRVWSGAFLSLPSAESGHQRWHADTPHLFHQHLPPHVLSVLVPLSDVTEALGPTEFRLGSHGYGNLQGPDGGPGVAPCPKAGSVLIYDYRIEHRGLANCAESPRPLLYLTYAKPWWRDVRNKKASRQ